MRTHKTQDVSIDHVNESQSNLEITPVDQGDEGETVSIARATLNGENFSDLHNSQAPYVINVKIEEDI